MESTHQLSSEVSGDPCTEANGPATLASPSRKKWLERKAAILKSLDFDASHLTDKLMALRLQEAAAVIRWMEENWTPPKIVTREVWDDLLAKWDHENTRLRALNLPSQRGAYAATKKRIAALDQEINSIDGVIGIDA